MINVEKFVKTINRNVLFKAIGLILCVCVVVMKTMDLSFKTHKNTFDFLASARVS